MEDKRMSYLLVGMVLGILLVMSIYTFNATNTHTVQIQQLVAAHNALANQVKKDGE